MSERFLLQGKATIAGSDNTTKNTEAQVRQALEHMGGQRLSLTAGSHGSAGRSGASSASARHRYVRDGEVPVVHAALGRTGARPDLGAQQDKAMLETLRQDLDRERASHEAAERSLHEARATLVTLQTRLAHVEMDLQAAKEAAQLAEQEAAERQQNLVQAASTQAATAHTASQPVASGTVTAPTPVRRRPRAEKVEPQREPQPVKWWIKTERS